MTSPTRFAQVCALSTYRWVRFIAKPLFLLFVEIAGICKRVSQSDMPFPRRENITKFIHAARAFGVLDRENVRRTVVVSGLMFAVALRLLMCRCYSTQCRQFDTGDLFDQSNMKQVLICLNALGRIALEGQIDGYDGPGIAGGSGACETGNTGTGELRTIALATHTDMIVVVGPGGRHREGEVSLLQLERQNQAWPTACRSWLRRMAEAAARKESSRRQH